MKTIKEYLSSNNSQTLLFESIDTTMSLQEVYEALYDKMFDNKCQLNEGLGDWLRKLADKGDKVDKKAAELKQSAEEKIKKMSDDAKAAIENVKAKAGESWDKVKNTYTAAVATIDDALQNAKTSVENVVKAAGIKMADFMATSAQVMSNLLAQGKEKLANSFKETKTAAAMQALLLGAILCKNNNIDSSQVLDILAAAGIQ
jgi:hypothetical protein